LSHIIALLDVRDYRAFSCIRWCESR